MKNIFVKLEYCGTNYFGFQIQNKKNKKEVSVQELFEKALKKLFCRIIRISYCSRTDRGVHAKAQCINFKVVTDIPVRNIKKALNSFLPDDIRVKAVKLVPLDFHARFSVSSKIYRYVIHNSSIFSVFLKDFSWHYSGGLNISLMNEISKKMIGHRDFSIFAKEAKTYKSCNRHLKRIDIKRRNSFIYIDIEADGFLRNMARNIVSFLVNVGAGKISIVDAKLILSRDKFYHNFPAPPEGLYLKKVIYP
ncbi:MAG: tRNA pseudouridine(38-40) synthase TruA [Candidatus Omnitrophica bacterium]|nr:tRNA pseudouridine(38-40) synthase TruA [Candidatus Omnitrophota bacterium]